jgi:hypothetical protein
MSQRDRNRLGYLMPQKLPICHCYLLKQAIERVLTNANQQREQPLEHDVVRHPELAPLRLHATHKRYMKPISARIKSKGTKEEGKAARFKRNGPCGWPCGAYLLLPVRVVLDDLVVEALDGGAGEEVIVRGGGGGRPVRLGCREARPMEPRHPDAAEDVPVAAG